MTFHRFTRTIILGGALAGAILLTPRSAPAQEGPKNLKVLPSDIEPQRLQAMMARFSQALGVQCNFCHMLEDFSSDENHHKDIARKMLTMMQTLRERQAEFFPEYEGQKMTCWTCHRGSAHIDAAPGGPPPGAKKGGKKGD